MDFVKPVAWGALLSDNNILTAAKARDDTDFGSVGLAQAGCARVASFENWQIQQ